MAKKSKKWESLSIDVWHWTKDAAGEQVWRQAWDGIRWPLSESVEQVSNLLSGEFRERTDAQE